MRLFALTALLLLRVCIDERESTGEFILENLLESIKDTRFIVLRSMHLFVGSSLSTYSSSNGKDSIRKNLTISHMSNKMWIAQSLERIGSISITSRPPSKHLSSSSRSLYTSFSYSASDSTILFCSTRCTLSEEGKSASSLSSSFSRVPNPSSRAETTTNRSRPGRLSSSLALSFACTDQVAIPFTSSRTTSASSFSFSSSPSPRVSPPPHKDTSSSSSSLTITNANFSATALSHASSRPLPSSSPFAPSLSQSFLLIRSALFALKTSHLNRSHSSLSSTKTRSIFSLRFFSLSAFCSHLRASFRAQTRSNDDGETSSFLFSVLALFLRSFVVAIRRRRESKREREPASWSTRVEKRTSDPENKTFYLP